MLLITDQPRRPRHAFDAYDTPVEFAHLGLALVEGEPQTVLDPGAGTGPWGTAARARWPRARIIGIEARPLAKPPAYDEWHVGPFELLAPSLPRVQAVVGNPPYRDAEGFIHRSLALLAPGGTAVFLLRLAFLASVERAVGLFRSCPPALVSICARRPIFYGDRNGATDFAFFVWREGHHGPPRLSWSTGDQQPQPALPGLDETGAPAL